MDYFQHRSILYIIKQSRNPRERKRGKDNLTILIPFKIDFSMTGELCIQLQILPIKKKKKKLQIHFLSSSPSFCNQELFFNNHKYYCYYSHKCNIYCFLVPSCSRNRLSFLFSPMAKVDVGWEGLF